MLATVSWNVGGGGNSMLTVRACSYFLMYLLVGGLGSSNALGSSKEICAAFSRSGIRTMDLKSNIAMNFDENQIEVFKVQRTGVTGAETLHVTPLSTIRPGVKPVSLLENYPGRGLSSPVLDPGSGAIFVPRLLNDDGSVSPSDHFEVYLPDGSLLSRVSLAQIFYVDGQIPTAQQMIASADAIERRDKNIGVYPLQITDVEYFDFKVLSQDRVLVAFNYNPGSISRGLYRAAPPFVIFDALTGKPIKYLSPLSKLHGRSTPRITGISYLDQKGGDLMAMLTYRQSQHVQSCGSGTAFACFQRFDSKTAAVDGFEWEIQKEKFEGLGFLDDGWVALNVDGTLYVYSPVDQRGFEDTTRLVRDEFRDGPMVTAGKTIFMVGIDPERRTRIIKRGRLTGDGERMEFIVDSIDVASDLSLDAQKGKGIVAAQINDILILDSNRVIIFWTRETPDGPRDELIQIRF
jgi:hypothetical protein